MTAPPNTRVTLEITLGEPDGGYRATGSTRGKKRG